MKLLIISDSYPPDMKSSAFLVQTLVKHLTSLGHQICIITLSRDIDDSFDDENQGDIRIIRLKIPSYGNNLIKRALIELSYSRKIISYLKHHYEDKVDGVICYSPSIFFGNAIRYIKKRWSVKCYLIVRDLFPDWAVSVGLMKKGLPYFFFKYFERVMMISSDFIGVEAKANIGHCKRIIGSRDVFIEQLPNWYEPEDIKASKVPSSIDKNKVNIIYGGVFGYAQDFISFLYDLETIENDRYRLILVGDGAERKKIEDFLVSSEMDIVLLKSMPRIEYLELVQHCDVGLIVINKNIKANNYPGKSFDYMSFKKPIFAYLNQDNEFGKMIDDSNFGYYANGDRDSFKELFNQMLDDEEERLIKGIKSGQVLSEFFSVTNASKKILNMFNNVNN